MVKRVTKKDQAIIDEALERFKAWTDEDDENRQIALDDLRFVDDDDGQWTEDARNKREGRPCMTFDRVSGAVDQIVGDMLQNRPAVKVRAAEDGDTDTADVYTGLIRAIENSSKGRRAHGTAFKYTVKCGFGVWRIRHDYADNESFNQDILIEPVYNPFSVVFDAYAKEMTKEDGRGAFVFEDLSVEEFESQYPNARTAGSFDKITGMGWVSEKTIRVAEYYRKVPETRTLYLLSTQEVVDSEEFDPIREEAEAQGITVVNEREVEDYKIEYYKLTAFEILEKIDYKGKYIPLVPVYGKVTNIDGQTKYRGIVRKAKDAQRAFNYEISNAVEQSALQPKAPYMATPAQIAGHEAQWRKIHTSNDPVLLYNADPQNPGAPQRQAPPQPSPGVWNIVQFMADNIKSATSIYDASLGARSNETSGKAIQARDRQGDTATYEFTDELVEAINYEGRILVDLIPKIYDTERQIRILGEDESEEVTEINKVVQDMETLEYVKINDLSRGKYDLHVQAGASYTTKRTETAEQLGQIMAQNPQMAAIVGDIYVKALDLVDGDDVIKRLRKIGIQQGFIEPNDEEKQEIAPQQQQTQQLQQAAAQLEMRLKQAEAAQAEADAVKTQAEARTEETEALLNTIDARLKQVELAQQQGDMESMMAQLQLIRGALSRPQPAPMGAFQP